MWRGFLKRSGGTRSIKAPSRKRSRGVGPITKSSSGRPKASRPGSPRGHTWQRRITTTNFPTTVPTGFLNKLGEMYTGEKELARALPLVEKAAKSKDLKTVLKIHLKETKGHVKALENVAKSLGRKMPSKRCKPITKLIGKAVKVIAKRIFSGQKDAELIEVGKKIEQFEIASYTPLITHAERLRFTHECALLASILNQEKLAAELLTALGQGKSPLDKLVKEVVLEHAGADTSPWAEAA